LIRDGEECRLPFDTKIFDDYEFLENDYLGEMKMCVHRSSNTILQNADEVVIGYMLMKNFELDLTEEISALLKRAIQYETVVFSLIGVE